MPGGRHRPPSDPTPGLWILLTLVMAGAALLWINRGELLDLLGLAETPPAEDAQQRGRLVLHIGGRVVADPDRVPDVDDAHGAAWEGLRATLRGDDLTVVDLGCAAAPPETEGARCDPAAIRALAQVGVDAVSLANERAPALGAEALEDTVATLGEAALGTIGAGADLETAWRPLLVEEAGWRVALVAATEVAAPEHAAAEDRPGVADGRDLEVLSERLAQARQIADVVVLILHWDMPPDGPNGEHVARAEELIDAGADVLVGHAPGVLGRMDRSRGRSIFWSLDSLLRPVGGGREIHTALARIVLTPDGAVRGRLVPVAIQSPGRAVLRGL